MEWFHPSYRTDVRNPWQQRVRCHCTNNPIGSVFFFSSEKNLSLPCLCILISSRRHLQRRPNDMQWQFMEFYMAGPTSLAHKSFSYLQHPFWFLWQFFWRLIPHVSGALLIWFWWPPTIGWHFGYSDDECMWSSSHIYEAFWLHNNWRLVMKGIMQKALWGYERYRFWNWKGCVFCFGRVCGMIGGIMVSPGFIIGIWDAC